MTNHVFQNGPHRGQIVTTDGSTSPLDVANAQSPYFLCLDVPANECIHTGLANGKANVYQYHLKRTSDDNMARYTRTPNTSTWVFSG